MSYSDAFEARGFLNDELFTRLMLRTTVKELWKSVDIWGSYGEKESLLVFFSLTYLCLMSTLFFCRLTIKAAVPPIVVYAWHTLKNIKSHQLRRAVIHTKNCRERNEDCSWNCKNKISVLPGIHEITITAAMLLLSEWKLASLLVKLWDFDLKTVKTHYGQLPILLQWDLLRSIAYTDRTYDQAISGTFWETEPLSLYTTPYVIPPI